MYFDYFISTPLSFDFFIIWIWLLSSFQQFTRGEKQLKTYIKMHILMFALLFSNCQIIGSATKCAPYAYISAIKHNKTLSNRCNAFSTIHSASAWMCNALDSSFTRQQFIYETILFKFVYRSRNEIDAEKNGERKICVNGVPMLMALTNHSNCFSHHCMFHFFHARANTHGRAYIGRWKTHGAKTQIYFQEIHKNDFIFEFYSLTMFRNKTITYLISYLWQRADLCVYRYTMHRAPCAKNFIFNQAKP